MNKLTHKLTLFSSPLPGLSRRAGLPAPLARRGALVTAILAIQPDCLR